MTVTDQKADLGLSPQQEESLNQSLAIYIKGNYETAYRNFELISENNPKVKEALKYVMKFCLNVINSRQSEADGAHELARRIGKITQFYWLPVLYLLIPLFKLFAPGQSLTFDDLLKILAGATVAVCTYLVNDKLPYGSNTLKLRCKYCGHLTAYIDPNEIGGYMGTNNCSVCGRGYPMPSLQWDNQWGQEYMYDRGSVTEPEFYREFESMNPGYPRSKIADSILQRNGNGRGSRSKSKTG